MSLPRLNVVKQAGTQRFATCPRWACTKALLSEADGTVDRLPASLTYMKYLTGMPISPTRFTYLTALTLS